MKNLMARFLLILFALLSNLFCIKAETCYLVDKPVYVTPFFHWDSFIAVPENSKVILSWSTDNEFNTSCFVIEHSSDGVYFDAVDTLAANNNPNSVSNYTYTHTTPDKSMVNYYRIKHIDINGNSAYSKIRVVRFDKEKVRMIQIMTSPVSNELKLVSNSDNISIMITDLNNKLIEKHVLQAGNYYINSSTWNSGIYQLSVFEKDKLVEVQRFVKL